MSRVAWVITALDIIPAVFTIIGNSIFFITLWRTTSLHTPSNVFLGFLSIIDLMVGLLCQPMFIILQFHADRPCCTKEMHVYNFVFYLTSWNSYLCIALITADRAVAIFYPFKYLEVASCKRFSIIAVLIFIISSSYVILERLFYDKSKMDFILVKITLQLLIFGLISVTYILIYRAIRSQSKRILTLKNSAGRRLRQNSSNERGKTKTVALIVFGFAFCTAPHIVLDFNMYFFYMGKSKFIKGLGHWANFFFLLNSALNPLIYFMSRNDIRSAARNLLCRSSANAFGTQETELKEENIKKYTRKRTINCITLTGEVVALGDLHISPAVEIAATSI